MDWDIGHCSFRSQAGQNNSAKILERRRTEDCGDQKPSEESAKKEASSA